MKQLVTSLLGLCGSVIVIVLSLSLFFPTPLTLALLAGQVARDQEYLATVLAQHDLPEADSCASAFDPSYRLCLGTAESCRDFLWISGSALPKHPTAATEVYSGYRVFRQDGAVVVCPEPI